MTVLRVELTVYLVRQVREVVEAAAVVDMADDRAPARLLGRMETVLRQVAEAAEAASPGELPPVLRLTPQDTARIREARAVVVQGRGVVKGAPPEVADVLGRYEAAVGLLITSLTGEVEVVEQGPAVVEISGGSEPSIEGGDV